MLINSKKNMKNSTNATSHVLVHACEVGEVANATGLPVADRSGLAAMGDPR